MDTLGVRIKQIKDLLKKNERGLTVTAISKELSLSRNSVAKYLTSLSISGEIEMLKVGPSKVYYLSHRIPLSTMLNVISDQILVLNGSLIITQTNDSFLNFWKIKKIEVLKKPFENFFILFEPKKRIIRQIIKALQGIENFLEIEIEAKEKNYFFNLKIIPTSLENGYPGVILVLSDITEQIKSNDSIKILLIDNNVEFLDIGTKIMNEYSNKLKIVSISSTEKAFHHLKKNEYDIIISDNMMPGLSGLDLLSQLREIDNFTPFILLIGKSSEDVAIQAFNLGVDYYLQKGDDFNYLFTELSEIVTTITEQKRETEELQEKKHLTQTLLDALPCVAMVMKPNRDVFISNKTATEIGILPGKKCYATWVQRDSPCPWCLTPKALKSI